MHDNLETWQLTNEYVEHYKKIANFTSGEQLLEEAIEKGSTAAMLVKANQIVKKLKHYIENGQYDTEEFRTCAQDCYRLLDQAVLSGDLNARVARAKAFTDCYYFSGQSINNYKLRDALNDLNVAINAGSFEGMRDFVSLICTSSDCLDGITPEDYLTASKLLRKINYQQNINSDCELIEREKKNYYLEKIAFFTEYVKYPAWQAYHMISAQNLDSPFWLWRHQIKKLYPSINLKDNSLEIFIKEIMEDELASFSQKCYFYQSLLDYFIEPLQTINLTTSTNIYQLIIQALDRLQARANSGKRLEAIAKLYQRIPLTTMAGATAQMSLADLYYNDIFNQSGDSELALVAAAPFHQAATKIFQDILKPNLAQSEVDTVLLKQIYFYQGIIKQREGCGGSESYDKYLSTFQSELIPDKQEEPAKVVETTVPAKVNSFPAEQQNSSFLLKAYTYLMQAFYSVLTLFIHEKPVPVKKDNSMDAPGLFFSIKKLTPKADNRVKPVITLKY